MLFFLIGYILVGFFFLQISFNKRGITKAFSATTRINQMVNQLIEALLSVGKAIVGVISAIINVIQTLMYFVLWPISYLYILHILSKHSKKQLEANQNQIL